MLELLWFLLTTILAWVRPRQDIVLSRETSQVRWAQLERSSDEAIDAQRRLAGAPSSCSRDPVGRQVLANLHGCACATTSVTAALGGSRFETEFKAGQRLSRDAAARLALREAAPPDGASDHPSAGVLGLREADVARLVADGLSNKEIGARLFISERTVESHVRNVLNKLGFNSRAQIASWMSTADR